MTDQFISRLATANDLTSITHLMQAAISELQKDFLTPAQVEASHELMGLDSQLIEDQTYFVIETDNIIVGCGGWSRRATLFGGNHTEGRDNRYLDPEKEAARIRAMYTHPQWVRKGIGRLILETCEQAAKEEGFSRLELMATLSGQPLYHAIGFKSGGEFLSKTSTGIVVPMIKMSKAI